MVITTIGKEYTAIRLGSDIPFVEYINIGSGSGTATISQKTLIAETDRNLFTSTDFSSSKKFTIDADFNSVEMSGTILREFGVVHSGAGVTGSIWQRESFASITFDGTNELKIAITWEIF